jgi:putative peptide zinc metalloprotease protein
MGGALFSPSWYRVAQIKPRIRSHARFQRHFYRNQLWYVLQDPATGRCHRLTPAAYHLIGLMDGQRALDQIWEAALNELGDDGPTQDETIRLLSLLHSADVLRCDVSPDTLELLRRRRRQEQAEWWRRYASPLSFRVPLTDPDAFLERSLPWVQPLFTRAFGLLCLGLIGAAAILAASNWNAITADATRQLLEPRNLLLLWLVYPIVKAAHELGHAYATKVWGGEVHEMGVLFLVLMPVPFVDASMAAAFPQKRRRMLVGAAGMLVELCLASLALFVWLGVEPGLVRSIAYNVMWIGGASTLLFNGNPLIKFDGYYVLSDAIEIPNLAARSSQYLGYLVQRHVFGQEEVRYPVTAEGEAKWFIGYGVASYVYRLFIMVGIALFISQKFFVLGIALAIFSVVMQLVVPAVRAIAFVLASPRLAEVRRRAIASTAGTALAVLVSVLLVPLPLFTRAQGVVWPPEGTHVRARADGFVLRFLAPPGAEVSPGQPLILTRDPDLETEVEVLEARLNELRAQQHAERHTDLVRAQMTQDEIDSVEAELTQARARVGDVVLRSPAQGTFVVPQATDLAGSFFEQGDLIGYVVGPSIETARVLLSQADVALVRERTRSVEVRLASNPGRTLRSAVQREVPAASNQLPSAALGSMGGGALAVDPSDPDGLRSLDPLFQLDVALPEVALSRQIGERVHVRFYHGSEPLGPRIYRAVRRLFLRELGV